MSRPRFIPFLVVALLLSAAVSSAAAHHARPTRHVKTSGDVKSVVNKFPCESKDLQWTGPLGMELVMLCSNHHVYSSKDFGSHWKVITGDDDDNGADGWITEIIPINGSTYVMLQGANSSLLYDTSDDAMVDPPKVKYPHSQESVAPAPAWLGIVDGVSAQSVVFDKVVPHPRNPNKAFAMKTDPSCAAVGIDRVINCQIFIFVTGVQGIKSYSEWRMITTLDWFWLSAEWGTGHADDDELFAVRKKRSEDIRSGSVVRLVVNHASMFGAANARRVDAVITGALALSRVDGYMFVSAFDPISGGLSLHVSDNDFRSLVKARFPNRRRDGTTITGKELGYSLVDVRDEIFVNVYRANLGTRSQVFARRWGATYVSGLHGTHFSLSLEFNRRHIHAEKKEGHTDFHRVGGLDGTIIANRVMNTQDTNCRTCDSAESCDQHCAFESVMSRDNGKTWQLIPPPEGMCDDDDSETQHCSLHLHGATSGDGSYAVDVKAILSSTTAPGLIIATGNVGDHLFTQHNKPRLLFISRDAGATWQLLSGGRHMYGEMNYGGLLYLTPLGQPVQHLNYSADGGKQWRQAEVSRQPLTFTDVIRTRHRPTARHTTLLATDDSGNTYTVYVDLSDTISKTCEDKDFEDFVPASYFTEDSDSSLRCLLGRRMTYKVKKVGRKCWVSAPPHPSASPLPSSFAAPSRSQPCECTRDDYECDWFYYEKQEVGTALPDSSGTTSSNSKQLTCVSFFKNPKSLNKLSCYSNPTYEESTGYRKIGGDGCRGGIDLNPVVKSCSGDDPSSSGSSSWSGFAKFVVFLIFVGLVAAIGRVAYIKHQPFRDIVDQVITFAQSLLPGGGISQPYRQVATDEDDTAAIVDDDDAGANSGSDDDTPSRRNRSSSAAATNGSSSSSANGGPAVKAVFVGSAPPVPALPTSSGEHDDEEAHKASSPPAMAPPAPTSSAGTTTSSSIGDIIDFED